MSRRHRVQLALGIVVTLASLALALWGFDRQDYRDIASSFRRTDYGTLPLLLGLLVVFFWLKALRWVYLLQPLRPNQPVTLRQSLSALMIGFMGNNVLPAHLGDFVRIFVFSRQHRMPNAAIFSTVLLERVFDVAAILALLGWGLATTANAPTEARQTSILLAVMLAIGCVVIFVYAKWTSWFVRITENILNQFSFLPIGLRRKACYLLESGAMGMSALRSGRLCVGIILTSALQWIINVWMIDISLAAFEIAEPYSVSAIVMGVVAFGVTIPSSPGFFGIIQFAFRATLVPFGVSATNAVAASVYYHMVTWAAVTLVGLLYLQKAGLRLGQLEHEAELEEQIVDEESRRIVDKEPIGTTLS